MHLQTMDLLLTYTLLNNRREVFIVWVNLREY